MTRYKPAIHRMVLVLDVERFSGRTNPEQLAVRHGLYKALRQAFGGAGGLHACELAQSMAIPRVLIPQLPGALSAYGILVSDIVKDYSRTVLWRVSGDLPYGKLQAEFRGFEKMAHSDFQRERWKGTPSRRVNGTRRSRSASPGRAR